jgi:hypothetical protein
MKIRTTLLMTLLVTACGPNIPPQVGEKEQPLLLQTGEYVGNADVIETEGSCGWVQAQLNGKVDVQNSQIVPGLGELLKCETSYPERGTIKISCKGPAGTIEGTGWVYSENAAYGRAVATGNVGGCKRVVLSWGINRESTHAR